MLVALINMDGGNASQLSAAGKDLAMVMKIKISIMYPCTTIMQTETGSKDKAIIRIMVKMVHHREM